MWGRAFKVGNWIIIFILGWFSYAQAVPSEDFSLRATCEGLWLVNDSTTATINDLCADAGTQGGANDGTTTGTVETTGGVPTGSPGTYLSGNFELADSDRSSIADNTVFEAANITVCAWVNPESVPAGDMYVLTKFAGGSGGWGLLVSSSDQFGEISIVFEDGNTAVSTATWTHICVRYDSGGDCTDCTDDRIEVLRNGSLNCTGACATQTVGPSANTDAVLLDAANSGAPSNFFDGLLHELVYFGEALENAEVCSICRCGVQGQNTTVTDRSASCGSCTFPAGVDACAGGAVPPRRIFQY